MRRWRLAISFIGVAVISGSVFSASALPRGGSTHRAPVVTTAASEFGPAADNTYVAWSANTVRRPRHFNVYVSQGGGPKQRVNPPGTGGATGGIDGTELIYSQTSAGDDDLVLYDMVTQNVLPMPPGVNTGRDEFEPSNSGDYLLFERDRFARRHKVERIVLHNTLTDSEIVLVETERRSKALIAGQVNGNWAVYFVCTRRVCNVFRYDILLDVTSMVPNPGNRQQYASSVTEAGVVYFVRSGVACGQNVRYMTWDGLTDPVLFLDFPDGRDSFDSFIDDTASSFYYERIRCRDFTSDIHNKSIL